MDEPFTGLDPVNVALLREAFLELRDQGRTLIFSTHQMETVEALCESIAIVDRGRVVVGGPVRDIRRAAGRRLVQIAVEGDHRLAWIDEVPGARILRPGFDRTEIELDAGVEPDALLAAAIAPRGSGDPLRGRRGLARADLHRPRRPAGRRGSPSRARCRATPSPKPVRSHRLRRAGRMNAERRGGRDEPLMPNVGIIARREYGGLVRSRLFFVSTLVLTGLAMFVALLPIVAKLVDRESRTTVAVVASDPELLDRSMAVLQGLLDQTGGGFDLVVVGDEQDAVDPRRRPASSTPRSSPTGARAASSASASTSARRWASSRSRTCRSGCSASPSSTTCAQNPVVELPAA